MTLPIIHALWIGNKLGKISSACLLSFAKQGHQVILHCYDDIEDLPNGVQTSDASLIIPKEKIFRHKETGSYALFSDIFRYELLKQVSGIYVDCDVYCLRQLKIPESGYLFGFEDDNKINGAVLALPKDSELLNKLIEIAYDSYFIAPWLPAPKKRILKNLFKSPPKHISEMHWGIIGPEAITYYAKQFNIENLAQKIDIFYPVHYSSVSMLLDGNLTINDITTHRTLCIHLYNEMLRKVDLDNIDKNSILYHIIN